jgi:hypothetical protein
MRQILVTKKRPVRCLKPVDLRTPAGRLLPY